MSDKAMTTNQTIDGVPRKPEWCEALLKLEVVREALTSSDSAERLKNMDAGRLLREGIAILKELRALLDAPEVLVVPLTGPKEWLDSLKTAAQPHGEPVAWTEVDVLDFMSVALRHAEYSGLSPSDILDGLRFMAEKGKPAFVRAEQPAPVAVVLPERRAVSPSSREQAMCANTWNACLDEVNRLNTK